MRIAPTGHRLFRGLRALAASALVSGMACGGSHGSPTPTQPASPGSSPVNLTGTWSGSASDSSGPGQMTWQLTQTDSSLSGTVTIIDTGTKLSGRGFVSGTISGSMMPFSISIPGGGFDSPYESCTASVAGDGQVSGSSITGTYSGSHSCTGAITSGQLTLNKQ